MWYIKEHKQFMYIIMYIIKLLSILMVAFHVQLVLYYMRIGMVKLLS